MKITFQLIILVLCYNLALAAEKPERSRKEQTVKEYLTPERIVWLSDNSGTKIKDADYLLIPGNGQADLQNARICELKTVGNDTCSIVLDYGSELHGGLEVITGQWPEGQPKKIRVRFGESVSEVMSDAGKSTATNDHAVRDLFLDVPWLGKSVIGNTGFRFVRIDYYEPDHSLFLKEINAISIYRDIEQKGSFQCNDTLLNKIWQTGANTVHLNMQEFLWDGIKRDRLVWVGDMHPEVMTINAVYGFNEVVPKSLDLIRDITPVTEWMNGICSYSMWWVIIHGEWYHHNGNLDYLREQENYLSELLQKFCASVDENGFEKLDGSRFLDWPSSPYPKAIDAGYQALLKMTLESGGKMMETLGNKKMALLCNEKVKLMAKVMPDPVNSKQAAALLSLSNNISVSVANTIIETDGAKRFSTFYGYYMLLAMAKANNIDGALNIIRQYWGGMLALGATSFWEDFNIEWMENAGRIDELPKEGKVDVHAAYGDYCYLGLRHSLCHGWASGPTAWISENILGVKVIEPGCKVVKIEPNLGDLTWAEGTYPTPFGEIKIRHDKLANGKIETKISGPKEVKIIKL
jgi:hypothetical protein